MSDTTTRGVRIQVRSRYLPERSSPRDSHYFFTYRIRISNVGEETVRLNFNHPLAGKTLKFNVKVVGLREPTSEELEHGHVHQHGHSH